MTRLLAVFVVTFIVVRPAPAEEWEYEDAETHVIASVSGNVIYGDMHWFVFFKPHCNLVQQIFTVYTIRREKFDEMGGQKFAIKLNGGKSETTLQFVKQAMLGHIFVFSLGTHDRISLLNELMRRDKLSIEMIDGNGFKASEIFDSPRNEWTMAKIPDAFERAHKLCIQKKPKSMPA